ncbi:MAG TPA: sugar phosphate isomerase/epimerase [Armatimonadetes bacterium]|jgi:3-dehydroshikimate dehydratase|nr:sugar phosphate isomerase/epimerase [Armatimonadota bacterium]
MGWPVIMHVNYCEQGQSLREICCKAAEWGFDGVEFRRKRTGVEEEPEAYLDALAEAVETSGLKHVLFGYPTANLMTPDAGEREREVESAIAFYRSASRRFPILLCNAFSGPLLNPDKSIPYRDYHKQGSGIATEAHYQWAAEGFRVLAPVAEELGFRFAFELHMGYLHDLPASAAKLIEQIDHPAVGANLDYGNIIYFAERPTLAESIRTLAGRLYYVHLKNSVALPTGGRLPTALADGEINHREYLRLLVEVGFEGPICIEAPRPGDREWFAQQDLAYIRSVIRDIAA